MEVRVGPLTPGLLCDVCCSRRGRSCSPSTVPPVPGGWGSLSTWPGWRWSRFLSIWSSKTGEGQSGPGNDLMCSHAGEEHQMRYREANTGSEDQHSQDYRAVNPLGQVPALRINGKTDQWLTDQWLMVIDEWSTITDQWLMVIDQWSMITDQ